jgi:hypothetical protein
MRFDELLSQLKETLEFCASLSLAEAVKASRFNKYQERIQRLCEIIQTYPREQLPQEIEAELNNENLEYVLSLTESLEFIGAVLFLKTCEKEILQRKIATVLRGPVLPNDEDENSNEARNTLFELNLASKLRKADLDASPGMYADIECTIGSKHLLIECKRPFKEHNVGKQIKKAGKQLKARLKTFPPGSRGIVAVSLSKTMNPGDKFFVYLDESSAKDALSRKLKAVAEAATSSWGGLGKRVIGILFHVVTASVDRKNDKYSLGEQFNAHPLAPEGSADYATFKQLCDALAKLQH